MNNEGSKGPPARNKNRGRESIISTFYKAQQDRYSMTYEMEEKNNNLMNITKKKNYKEREKRTNKKKVKNMK